MFIVVLFLALHKEGGRVGIRLYPLSDCIGAEKYPLFSIVELLFLYNISMKFIKRFGLFFHGLFCQKLLLGPFVICKSMYFFLCVSY